MPLLSRLIRSRATPARKPMRVRRSDDTEAPAPGDDRPRGCGWFDSSHELARGLRITEHERADEIARLVPLAWWLAWELDEPAPRPR